MSLDTIRQLDSPACLDVFISKWAALSTCQKDINGLQIGELKKLHIGQSLDLFWTSNVQCPTFEEYYKMVDYSTYFYSLSEE